MCSSNVLIREQVYSRGYKPEPAGNIPVTLDDGASAARDPPFENLSAPGLSAYAAAVALNPKEYA